MTLINQCSDCVIRTFIACKFDNNLKGLIVEGNPSKDELIEAFDAIETEFNDLCGVFPDELKQTNKINALIARNKSVELCFFAIDECLRRAGIPCPDAVSILKQSGIFIKWKDDDINDYQTQVNNAKTRNISKEVELEELTKGLQDLQQKSVKSPQFTKKNFYQIIHSAQAMGFKVSEHETNMYSFGIMCNDLYTLQRTQKTN